MTTMGSLHPVIISRLLSHLLSECRISSMLHCQARREWLEHDDTIKDYEIPTSGSMSGWMSNDREAKEFLHTL